MTYRSEKNSRFQAVFAGEKSFKIVLRIPKLKTLRTARIFSYYKQAFCCEHLSCVQKTAEYARRRMGISSELKSNDCQKKSVSAGARWQFEVSARAYVQKYSGICWLFPDFFVPLHRFPRSRWQEKSSGLLMLRWGRQTILFTKDGRSN